MWAIFPGDEHLQAVIELMTTNSERVGAVVGGVLLDKAVDRTLRMRFRDHGGIVNNILNVDQPLGNLRPKIDVLYLLGAFDDKTRGALKGIAGVRNFFAHNLDASFGSSGKEFSKAMSRLILHENKTHYPHRFYGPDTAVPIEPIRNKRDQFVVNLRLALIMLMRDRFSHEAHTNLPFTDEQLKEKYQERREREDREASERT